MAVIPCLDPKNKWRKIVRNRLVRIEQYQNRRGAIKRIRRHQRGLRNAENNNSGDVPGVWRSAGGGVDASQQEQ
jgi:hypothetical protein